MTSAPTIPDSPLTTDLRCAKCHYNLRTKKPSELCPECAHPVADSITFRQSSPFARPRLAAFSATLFAISAAFTAATFVVASEIVMHSFLEQGDPGARAHLRLLSSMYFFAALTLIATMLLLLTARSRPTSISIRICWRIISAIAMLYFLVDFRLVFMYFGDDPLLLRPGHTPEMLLIGLHHLCHACLLLAGCLYIRTLSGRYDRPALFISASLLLFLAMPWELNRSLQLFLAYFRVPRNINWPDILYNLDAILQWPHFVAHLLLIPAGLLLAFTLRRKSPTSA